jgi:hypothetical protein
MKLPVYKRRFYLGQLTRAAEKREEELEQMKEKSQTKGGKGNRTTRISGNQLKNRIKSGDLPLE